MINRLLGILSILGVFHSSSAMALGPFGQYAIQLPKGLGCAAMLSGIQSLFESQDALRAQTEETLRLLRDFQTKKLLYSDEPPRTEPVEIDKPLSRLKRGAQKEISGRITDILRNSSESKIGTQQLAGVTLKGKTEILNFYQQLEASVLSYREKVYGPKPTTLDQLNEMATLPVANLPLAAAFLYVNAVAWGGLIQTAQPHAWVPTVLLSLIDIYAGSNIIQLFTASTNREDNALAHYLERSKKILNSNGDPSILYNSQTYAVLPGTVDEAWNKDTIAPQTLKTEYQSMHLGTPVFSWPFKQLGRFILKKADPEHAEASIQKYEAEHTPVNVTIDQFLLSSDGESNEPMLHVVAKLETSTR